MADDYTAVIDKLNRETIEGKIAWEIDNEPVIDPNDYVEILQGNVYKAKIEDKILMIYKYIFLPDEDLGERIHLAFVNDKGFPIWAFPENYALHSLLQSVMYKAEKIDEFLENYLKKTDDK